ncbi:unnamed protein product [Orchesella dallaii]|uniref:Uncharacterized protein n=1 Tax=Orchesella dallaii TaxID=48710 RepID=A0ABP1QPD0_9HEXA
MARKHILCILLILNVKWFKMPLPALAQSENSLTVQKLFSNIFQKFNLQFYIDSGENVTRQKSYLMKFLDAHITSQLQTIQITTTNTTELKPRKRRGGRRDKNMRRSIQRSPNTTRRFSLLQASIYLDARYAQRTLKVGMGRFMVMPHLVILINEKPSFQDWRKQKKQKTPLPYEQLHELKDAPLTSVFLVLDNTLSTIKMLCFPCTKQFNEQKVSSGFNFNLYNLNRQWDLLNKNFRGVFVHVDIQHWLTTTNFGTCNIHKYTETHNRFAEICVFKILHLKLNYSYTMKDWDKVKFQPWRIMHEAHGSVFSKIVLERGNMWSLRFAQGSMVSYAMSADPYTFFVVLDKVSRNNMYAILQPFDLSTWIALAVTSIMFSLTLFAISLKSHGLQSTSAHRIWFTIIGTVIDQPASDLFQEMHLSSKRTVLMTLWTLWCLVALNISFEYKGTLVSAITKKPNPKIPETFDSLLASELFMTTFETVKNNEGGGVSMLKGVLLNDILNSLDEPIPNSNVFKRLNDSLIWIPSRYQEFVKNVALNNDISLPDNSTLSIPQAFAVMDVKTEANLLRILLKFFTDKWISQTFSTNALISRAYWAVLKNYFHRFFTPSLSRLEESALSTVKRYFIKHYFRLVKILLFLGIVLIFMVNHTGAGGLTVKQDKHKKYNEKNYVQFISSKPILSMPSANIQFDGDVYFASDEISWDWNDSHQQPSKRPALYLADPFINIAPGEFQPMF